jgi:hypothetical protein
MEFLHVAVLKLTVDDFRGGTSTDIVAITVEGVPTASVSPSSLHFGNQLVNTAGATQTITIANTGAASLAIASVGLVGAHPTDFETTADNCAGSRSATLSVTDNTADGVHAVALDATGSIHHRSSRSSLRMAASVRTAGTTTQVGLVIASHGGPSRTTAHRTQVPRSWNVACVVQPVVGWRQRDRVGRRPRRVREARVGPSTSSSGRGERHGASLATVHDPRKSQPRTARGHDG